MANPNPHFLANQFLFVLSFVIVVGSVFSSMFWFFLPAGMAMLSTRIPRLGVAYVIGLSAAMAWGTYRYGLAKTDLDYISLFFLIAWGFFIIWKKNFSFKFWKKPFLWFWGSLIVVCGLVFGYRHFIGSFFESLDSQTQSMFLPILFNESSWSPENLHFYKNFLALLFSKMLVGVYVFYFGIVLIFNLLVFKMTEPSLEKRFRFWESFSSYRPSDWVLIPLVLGLMMVVSVGFLVGSVEWSWLSFWGWSLFFLSALPLAVNGISLLSFFLPRLGSFFAIFVLILFIFAGPPYPFLIILGGLDIWFDFRRRMRSNPKTEDFN
jgi:hypothetical protein